MHDRDPCERDTSGKSREECPTVILATSFVRMRLLLADCRMADITFGTSLMTIGFKIGCEEWEGQGDIFSFQP